MERYIRLTCVLNGLTVILSNHLWNILEQVVDLYCVYTIHYKANFVGLQA